MTRHNSIGERSSERGIALVLSLFLMLAMSVIAASLMFMSQSETYSSMSYRLMSQARYGAESGIAVAANYLMYPATYTPPTTGGADPLASYNYIGVSPVTLVANGQPVILSANPNVASNYPVAAVQTAFNNAVQGALAMSSANVQYQPYAKLIAMRQINVYGGGVQTIQTWQIVSDGVVAVGRTAKVEVTAIIESVPQPATLYGAFATNGGCGALTFGGSDLVNSYDSSQYNTAGGATPTAGNGGLSNSGGNVGTNGNLGESGNATIYGTLSTPRTGVGNCSSGNVDALSASHNANLCPDPTQACNGIQDQNADLVHLPQTVSLPTPALPNPMPPVGNVSIGGGTTCAALGLTAANCSGAAGNLTLTGTVTLGDIQFTGGTLTLSGATVNINSISMTGNSTLNVAQAGGPNVINVAGVGFSGNQNVIDTTGGSISNPSFDASKLQIEYGGSASVKVNGGAKTSEVVYAPNATVSLNGNSDFWGAVIGNMVTDNGNNTLHFDRHLSGSFYTVGNTMLSAFSWKRF